MKKEYSISVIVCTYNRMEFLPKALKSLVLQKIPTGNNFEIIIVNNNSSDATEEFCLQFIKEHPEVSIQYLLEENQGLSFARNKGIEYARGSYLYFLDDDAIPCEDCLAEYLHFFQNNSTALAAGGKISPLFETERPTWMSSYLLDITSSLDLGNELRIFPKNKYPIGANMCFRSEVFELIPKFNVHLGRRGANLEGGEEKEVFTNLKKHSRHIYYLPKAQVDHAVPAKRLTQSFFIRLATGIGYSEKERTLSRSKYAYLLRLLLECYKWMGTWILCLLYCFKLKPKQGFKLVEYRWYISKALLGITTVDKLTS